MQPYQTVYLKKNEERRVLAGHLWIYSNEIDVKRSPLKQYTSGETVSIFSAKDKPLGVGYINPHSLIAVRMLSLNPAEIINKDFFIKKIRAALFLREKFYTEPFYRLVFADSDYLSGLVIDRYQDIFVMQTNSAGMEHYQPEIMEALQALFKPKTIILKNDSSIRSMELLDNYVTIKHGEELADTIIRENNIQFNIPLLEGQKTGWFYDHRDNRAKLAKYVRNKRVLDVFSYVGGWGIQAAMNGATEVMCIDSSAKALQYAEKNAQLNNCETKVNFYPEDAFVALKKLQEQGKKFDVIILDPPALIKKRKDLDSGIIAYLRLNELALNLLPEQGVLISCSCSLHMSPDKLNDTIRRAGLKTNKNIQIVEMGLQGMDHPVHPAIPETAYLKAFFCVATNQGLQR